MSERTTPGSIKPERWPTERPLLAIVVLVSAVTWLVLIVTIVGALYGALFALFFFVSHLVFVAHLRGSAVKLGPNQFPDLYRRVADLSQAMDLEAPETYLMQAGGSLNAFATRFFRRNIVVLYSDLLEACGDDHGARDMIIAHELAHVRCGHLKWMWFLLPGYFMPLLGSALSRAREYTCDRYGSMGAVSLNSATRGLAILAAGAKFAPSVDLKEFVRQRGDLNTGMMTLGEWFGSHPPLSKRVAALDASLAEVQFHPTRGRAMAVLVIATVSLVGVGGSVAAAVFGTGLMDAFEEATSTMEPTNFDPVDPQVAASQVMADFESLAALIDRGTAGGLGLPGNMAQLIERWQADSSSPYPRDPFDGFDYGFDRVGERYRLWSVGSDGLIGTDDDISFEGPSE